MLLQGLHAAFEICNFLSRYTTCYFNGHNYSYLIEFFLSRAAGAYNVDSNTFAQPTPLILRRTPTTAPCLKDTQTAKQQTERANKITITHRNRFFIP